MRPGWKSSSETCGNFGGTRTCLNLIKRMGDSSLRHPRAPTAPLTLGLRRKALHRPPSSPEINAALHQKVATVSKNINAAWAVLAVPRAVGCCSRSSSLAHCRRGAHRRRFCTTASTPTPWRRTTPSSVVIPALPLQTKLRLAHGCRFLRSNRAGHDRQTEGLTPPYACDSQRRLLGDPRAAV